MDFVAHLDTFSISYKLNVLDKLFENSSIINSGVTDRMTDTFKHFHTYASY